MINFELLFTYNPWWKSGRVPKMLLGRKREFLKEILSDLPKKQILLVSGLRRVGKTTLLYQLIDHLLKKGTNPLHILYFSFEDEREEIFDLLKLYREDIVLEKAKESERTYLLLDEVQKLDNYSSQLKRIYDLYPNIKIVASGSAALNLEKRGKESLAGRAIFYLLPPLSFPEYLKFKNVTYDKSKIKFYKSELRKALSSYFIEGGFIEIMGETNEFIARYFKELLIERVIFKDIPQTFSLDEPDLAYRILKIIAADPGLLVDYRHLASDLGRDWRTIKKYADLLEYSLLTKKLYQYSSNLLTSEKKLRKYYPASTSLSFALFPERLTREDFLGKLAEVVVINHVQGRFFWRSGRVEVDLVLEESRGKTALPIEVKYRQNISGGEISGLTALCRNFSLSHALVITNDLEKKERRKNVTVSFLPLWRFLLEG